VPKAFRATLGAGARAGVSRLAVASAYGQVGRVRKRRTLYQAGRTRIHLDRVEGLGDFLELEVVLAERESPEGGLTEAHAVMEALAISPSQLVEAAYVDLLTQRTRAEPAAPLRTAGG
jgi:predicted adenylyl cyclase CyaB